MKHCIILMLLLLSVGFLHAKATIYHLNIEKTITKDIFYYATHGNVRAQFDLANQYKRGINRPVNLKKAFYFYHSAALKNYAPAQYQLAMAFRKGLGVKANQELARYWFRKSAKNRYRDAINMFKRYYSKKIPIKQFQFQRFAKVQQGY